MPEPNVAINILKMAIIASEGAEREGGKNGPKKQTE